MTTPDEADRQQLADWLKQLERMMGATYAALDLPVDKIVEQKLKAIRIGIEGDLLKLDKLVRMRSEAVRAKVITEHLAALRAIKLLRDDILLVELEVLRARRLPAADAAKLRAQINTDYELFLKNWVKAGPLLHADTVKWFWPDISDFKKSPAIRGIAAVGKVSLDMPPPIVLARDAIKPELKRLLNDPDETGFSRSTVHLIGIAYILAQVELAQRFAKDQSFQADVNFWYRAAAIPADIIRELLGSLDLPLREAIRDGKPLLRNRLTRARRRMLTDLALHYSVPALECATLAGFSKAVTLPNEVVGVNGVTEKVMPRAGQMREDRSRSREVMYGYLALTGFPLVYPFRDVAVRRPALRWDRVARPVLVRSFRESFDHLHEGFFSVSETVTEQHELIADVISFEDVRKRFATALKSQASLPLIDRTIRGGVLAQVMKSLGVLWSPDQALVTIIRFIQRYLSYFTRHTADNVRDSGTPYLSSKWPTDLDGRQFFDCGVYAVETAFDLMRVANAISGLTLEFRFLVFPEHLTLVVYHDQTSFAVNNARIFLPKPFTAGSTIGQQKADAGFSWAVLAMQDASSARFAIIPVMLQDRTLSSKQSEAAFKTAIWALYQTITGYDIAKNVGKAYYDSAKAFDAGSTLLTLYLMELAGGKLDKKGTAEIMDRATELTEKLYQLAVVLADACNFVDTKSAGLIPRIGAHVDFEDELVQAAPIQRQLPMYAFVRLLQKPGRSLNAAQQQLANLRTGQDHVNDLSGAMTQVNCTAKTTQTLAAAHGVRTAEIQNQIAKAPARILDRIKAAGDRSTRSE